MNYKFPDINKNIILSVLLLFGLISPSLFAQNGGFAGASHRIGYSARGMAMSNAMSAVTSEGVFAYYNPAQAALFSNIRQADLTVGALKFDRVFQSSGIHLQLPPSAGISINLLRSGVQDIDGRTVSGYPTELFNINEYQLASNFGIRMSERFHAGIGLKFSLADYHAELDNAFTVGIDLGFLYFPGNYTSIGVSVKDLLANYTWNPQQLYGLDQGRNEANDFPTRIVFGFAYQRDKYTISSDFEIQTYTSELQRQRIFIDQGNPITIMETETITTSSTQFRLGGSWKAHERFTLRAGWQLPETTEFDSWSLSSGFSIHLPFDVFSPSIDYAFVMEPYRISNMHVFSLRLNL
ncbi:hypothetical protein [Gracilimonas sp.]|uniref:hypothetical protein n=1 Tax=Gracilimonas sp. TaxID=1974203 RepID=UPI0032EFD76A